MAAGRDALAYNTHIGSLDAYEKGTIELKDDLRKYAFSNVFEVAGKATSLSFAIAASYWREILYLHDAW